MREQGGQTLEIVKRCSGLHGNMQRLAEMTSPNDHKSLSNNGLDNPTECTAGDFETVSTLLQNADAEFIGEVIEGEMKIGTGPVRDTFFCMCSTRLIPRLSAMNGYINKAQYPSQLNVLSAEHGSVGNVRFVISSRGSVTTSASLLGADVYNMFVTGQESYTSIQLDGESAKFIYHPPGLTNLNSTTYVDAQVLDKPFLIDLEAYVMQEAA